MPIQMADTLTLDGVKKTREGYLTVDARVARIGIQEYRGSEVGKPDMGVVRVYRPEKEVFNKDTIASFAGIAVTLDHPSELVTADNWRKVGVGETSEEILRDGEYMRTPMMVRDAAAIRIVETGDKRELSCGYTCDLDWTAGRTDDGLEYDAIQTNIRGNHVAIVSRARGGPELKIGDEQMPKMVTVDGHNVELGDAAAIAVAGLQTKLTAADAKVADLTTQVATRDTSVAELTTKLATKDAEIATLKTQLADAAITPEKLREAGKSYTATVDAAKKIAPTLAIGDGLDEPAIKKAVVLNRMGDAAKDWTDAQIAVSFETLKGAAPQGNQMRDSIRALPSATQTTDSKAAYLKMVEDMQNPETAKAS